jgi:hypothetical protein
MLGRGRLIHCARHRVRKTYQTCVRSGRAWSTRARKDQAATVLRERGGNQKPVHTLSFGFDQLDL